MAMELSKLETRVRTATRCAKNVLSRPVSVVSSGCSLFAILKSSGLAFVLSCPLFAPSPAAPAVRQPPNLRRQLARSAPASPFRERRSLPPQERPQGLHSRQLPAPTLPSRPPLLTRGCPPPSHHLRAWPPYPVASVLPRQRTPPQLSGARPPPLPAPARASPLQSRTCT